MTIKIGVMGLLGSGKSTFGEMLLKRLQENYCRWTHDSYAAPIKDLCCEILGVSLGFIENRHTKEAVMDFNYDKEMEDALYNYLKDELKFFGVELSEALRRLRSNFSHLDEISPRQFLQYFGTNVVRAVDSDAWVKLLHRKYNFRPVLITDVRFDNEYVDVNYLICRFTDVERPEHPSEHLAWDLQFDDKFETSSRVVKVYNTSSLEALEALVDEVVENLKMDGLIR